MKTKRSELLAALGCCFITGGCTVAFTTVLTDSKPEYKPAPIEHVRAACDAGDEDACEAWFDLRNAEDK